MEWMFVREGGHLRFPLHLQSLGCERRMITRVRVTCNNQRNHPSFYEISYQSLQVISRTQKNIFL